MRRIEVPLLTIMRSRVGIPKSRALVVEKAVGRWDFSAHDFSDEELVHCAQTMFEHAFTMPEVADHVIKSGTSSLWPLFGVIFEVFLEPP